MKTTLKFIGALVLPLLAVGCSGNDDPELEGFPKNSIELSIDGLDNPETTVSYDIVYNNNGELKLKSDSDMAIADIFALDVKIKMAVASPEDVVIQLEPYALNIPVEQVELSQQKVVIGAGNNSASVSIRFKGEDVSFMESVLDAQTYELGVKVRSVNGYQVESWTPEVKLVANKEAYASFLSLNGEYGNEESFRLTYADGNVEGDELSYKFWVSLDKPALEDVTISFETLDVPAEFASDVTFTPKEVIIPAGSTVPESQSITWSIKPDFLLTTDWVEFHDWVIRSICKTEGARVDISGEENQIHLQVLKNVQAIEFAEERDASWVNIDNSSWSISTDGDGGNILEGDAIYGYWDLEAIVDLKDSKDVVAFGLTYADYYDGPNIARDVTISISEDGKSWARIGTLEDLPRAQYAYFKMKEAHKIRYVKFNMGNPVAYYVSLSAIDIFSLN